MIYVNLFWYWSFCILQFNAIAISNHNFHESTYSVKVGNLKTLEELCKHGKCDSNFYSNLKIHSNHGNDCKVKKVLNHYYEHHQYSYESGNTQHSSYKTSIENNSNNETSNHNNSQYNFDDVTNIEQAKEKFYNFDDDYEFEEIEWFKGWHSSSATQSSYSVKSYSSNPEPSNNCKLPFDENIVPVTPRFKNKGFAMSPDEECKPGTWCPVACINGYFSPQYSPSSTCSNGPECGSNLGGGFCNANGTLSKAFPEKPWCIAGVGNIGVVNKLEGENDSVSFCQTVLPGNEAMLIPTVVKPGENKTLNVPPSSYWQSTSAHYYLNPAKSNRRDCKWSNSNSPTGNWASYVAGMSQDSSGLTYASLSWNPEFIRDKPPVKGLGSEYSTKSYHMRRSTDNFNKDYELYKVKIECEQGECLGLPCSIDPSQGINGGGCTVTLKPGSRANFVLY